VTAAMSNRAYKNIHTLVWLFPRSKDGKVFSKQSFFSTFFTSSLPPRPVL